MPVEVIPTVTDEDVGGNKQEDGDADEAARNAASSKPMMGIIYPPPEVRNIVDKTAGFVARNGPEFEHRIRQNEINNAKFNFLNHGDPYHAYFRHKVQDFLEGKAQEPLAAPVITKIPSLVSKSVTQALESLILKEAPQEPEFVADPPTINAFELDIVKLTAQFVARNGRQFLTSLMNREQRNYHFDFLRPQHSMFTYFTKLVEQYTKVLIPPKELLGKLRFDSEQSQSVMEAVNYRVQWAKHQEAQRKKEEEEREKERVSYSQIDWHGFVVVETVDFQPGEQGNFPPPLRPEDIGRRILAEKRYEQFGELEEEEDVEMEVESGDEEDSEKEDGKGKNKKKKDTPSATPKEKTTTPADQNTEVQDMDEGDSDMDESDEEEDGRRLTMSPPPLPSIPGSAVPPPLPPQLGEVQIRKNYDPKAPKQVTESEENYLISPITGEKIASSKMAEHMRIGLLDPRWIEQRDRQKEKQAQEEVFAPGMAIEESLKLLAERRTDIFGEGDVETQIGKKLGEEDDTKTKQKVIWDGHSASMEATARKAQANITIDEQIAALHKAQGLVPDKEKEKIGPQPVSNKGKPLPPRPAMPKQHPQASMPIPPPPQPPKSSAPQHMQYQPRMPLQPPGMPLMQRGSLMQMPPRPPMPPRMPQPPVGMPRMGGGLLPGPPLRFMNRGPGMGQPMGGMGMPGGPPMRPGRPMPPGVDIPEPPMKKQKTEESLMPEELFIARNKGPVSFQVMVPPMPDKPEWKCSGQALQMTLPLTDTISVIKAKIFEETSMPAGKQKLQFDGLFVKDSNTLAFYNFGNGCTLQLGLKERGGRKR
ncbi:splicing factor 3A subunit 1-like isoform X2 [Asterias rubens]|uniref:splicing factor 3A subunit 1-like isoform X1 n=1 Tax=Asterias rubens TaxID=7604 RepID=UPI0014554956|nr:splicing factor 3A subunit 1-like isoform X1 [Asterias rubens]XP_033638834.1 splicing factor 3A subunit 1-like isoform X2 [Asterias rubens]